jgi:hypothetical protein
MKLFSISKLSIVLVCLGGALLAAPQSRAQSEIAPDHFDGTDSWAAAAKSPRAKAHAAPTAAAAQAGNPKPASPVLQPVAVRRPDASTTKRRKSTTPNSSN